MPSQRIQSIDSSGIRKVFDLAAKMKNPCNLSIGQPHFDAPASTKTATIEAIQSGKNAYTQTQGILPLREAVLKSYAAKGVPQEDVLITSGVTGGLLLTIIALLDAGDEVIVSDPYFVMYKHLPIVLGVKPVYVDTYPSFHWEVDKLEAAITPKTKAIIVNSPANPTGVSATENELRMIAEVAKKHNLWVIYDEIYEYFSYDSPHVHMSCYYPKTVTLNGFSKSHSLTGWRLGTAVGPKMIIEQMIKLQQYSFVCAPSMAQWGALAALDVPMNAYVEDYKHKRDLMVKGLSQRYEVTSPDGAFYMFIKAPSGMCGEEFVFKALEKELIVIPGGVFSERDTHFRLSFASSDENLERGIKILNSMV